MHSINGNNLFTQTQPKLERSQVLFKIKKWNWQDALINFPFIAELAQQSPIIIQNNSNPSSRKNLDVRPYKVLLLTCVVNCIVGTPMPQLCSVVSALGSELDDPGSSPGRGKVLCPWDVQEKKMRAPLLGLAKSIYYVRSL